MDKKYSKTREIDTFGFDIILGRDNSLHNLTMTHLCEHRTPIRTHKPTDQER